MKKIFSLRILIILALFASCRTAQVSSTKSKPEEHFQEVRLKMTLDSLAGMESGGGGNARAANDGIFDWVWLGDGFNQSNKWFFDSLCDHQEAFIKTVYPLDSLWRAGKINFIRKISNGNFNCKVSGMEALACNWDKIRKAAYADGTVPDFIHIFSYNNGYGTGNGGIGITGVGNVSLITAPWPCPYYRSIQEILNGVDPGREPKISGHEDGHGFGLEHALVPTYIQNLMSQATNGGCELGSTYLPKDWPIILNYIKSKIQ